MNRNNGVRDEYIQEKNRRAMRVFNELTPDGGFEDDPAAQSYDRNGRASVRSQNYYPATGLDLGGYPAVD